MSRMFRICIAICISMFIFNSTPQAKSQVPNPKFTLKKILGCPTSSSWTLSNYPIDYNNVCQNWYNSTDAVADYFHGCNPNTLASVPNAWFNYSAVDDANAPNTQPNKAYSGLFISEFPNMNEYRSYITVPLQSPLLVGQTYTITYKVFGNNHIGAGDYSFIKRFGALLTVNPVSASIANGGDGYVDPLFGNYGDQAANTFYTDTWTTVTIPITITGANKNYLTIGNFQRDIPGNEWSLGQYPSDYPRASYYFVDDVKIVNTSGCCDFTVYVERDKSNTSQQCCYKMTIETGSNVCPITSFVIRDPNSPSISLGGGSFLGGLSDNQTITINTCITSTEVADLRIDFYDANGNLVCQKNARFDCECNCTYSSDNMRLHVKRVISTPNKCCFKVFADNVGPCDFTGFKIVIPNLPGTTFTQASGISMTSSGGMLHLSNGGTFEASTSVELGTLCIPPGSVNLPFVIKLVKLSNSEICLQKAIPLSCSNLECCDAIQVTQRIPSDDEIRSGKTCCTSVNDPINNGIKLCCTPIIEFEIIPTPNCPLVAGIEMTKDGAVVFGLGWDGKFGKSDYPFTPCPTSVATTYELKFYDANNNLLCTKSFTVPGCSLVGKVGSLDSESKTDDPSFELTVNPNPVGQQLVLQVGNTKSAQAAVIDIYDLAGNKVLSVHDGGLKNGQNTYTVGVSSLPVGRYLVKVKSDIGTQTISFVKE